MVIREEHKNKYTKIDNKLIMDKELSLSAKGLLITMLSLPDDWSYSTVGLSSIVKESKNTIHRLLKELELKNYLIRKSIRDDKGRFIKYNYCIYELPYPNIRDMDLPDMDICDNNNIINNKDKIDKYTTSEYTKELIRIGFINKNDINLLKYDDLYKELIQRYDYKLVYICTRYIINNLKQNNNRDESNNIISSKYSYLRSSLINNLDKMSKEIVLW